MRILAVFVALSLISGMTVLPLDAEAAKKKTSSGIPQMTKEQRKKLYDQGLAWCRKKYGAQLHFVRLEKYYGKFSIVCYHY